MHVVLFIIGILALLQGAARTLLAARAHARAAH